MYRWEIIVTDEFARWYDTLEDDQADALDARVELLRDLGPALGRPTVDRVTGSALDNLKELRVRSGGELRVLLPSTPSGVRCSSSAETRPGPGRPGTTRPYRSPNGGSPIT